MSGNQRLFTTDEVLELLDDYFDIGLLHLISVPPPVEDLYFHCFNPSGNVKIFVLTPLRKIVLPHLE